MPINLTSEMDSFLKKITEKLMHKGNNLIVPISMKEIGFIIRNLPTKKPPSLGGFASKFNRH